MSHTVELEMGLDHAEFFRTLPSAMGNTAYTVRTNQVLVEQTGRQLTISLAPEQRRRIALLNLPYTTVRFDFQGYEQTAIDAFMDYFLSRYQRGGG